MDSTVSKTPALSPARATLLRPWSQTPMIESAGLSKLAGCLIIFNRPDLLNLGIGNFIRHSIDQYPPGTPIHFYALSGGNAGLACVHAARTLGQPATVVVPLTTKSEMVQKLVNAGATSVLQQGASLKEAAIFLSDLLQRKADQDIEADRDEGENSKVRTVNIFVPPYDHQFVWSGNGTLAWEIAEQLAELEGIDVRSAATSIEVALPSYSSAPLPSVRISDPVDLDRPPATAVAAAMATSPPAAILCSVGGGGLMNGIVEGLDGLEEACLVRAINTVPENVGDKPPSSLFSRLRPPTWCAVPIVATETAGADSLAASMQAWENAHAMVVEERPNGLSSAAAASVICPHPVTLDRITSAATSLGVSRVSERTFAIATGLYNNGGIPVDRLQSLEQTLSDSEFNSFSDRFAFSESTSSPMLGSTFSPTPRSSSGSSASSVSDYNEKPMISASSMTLAVPSSQHRPIITTTNPSLMMIPPSSRPSSRRPTKTVRSMVLSDGEAALGCVALADTDRLMVELACGINVAALLGGRLEKALGRRVGAEEKVVVVVCGGSDVSVERLVGWREQYGGVETLMKSVV